MRASGLLRDFPSCENKLKTDRISSSGTEYVAPRAIVVAGNIDWGDPDTFVLNNAEADCHRPIWGGSAAEFAPEPVPLPERVPLPQPEPLPVPNPDPLPLPDAVPSPVPEPLPDPGPAPFPVLEPVPEPAPVPGPNPGPRPMPDPALLPEPVPPGEPLPRDSQRSSPPEPRDGPSPPLPFEPEVPGPPPAPPRELSAARIICNKRLGSLNKSWNLSPVAPRTFAARFAAVFIPATEESSAT